MLFKILQRRVEFLWAGRSSVYSFDFCRRSDINDTALSIGIFLSDNLSTSYVAHVLLFGIIKDIKTLKSA